ncbi:division/cell wall cluster transcriptional repressor MraZ [Pseudogemmobacter sp. W21_MBD1_M6]|uniref:division/cell wall cluster transcriptional repressor MraZ n=1 Tax=Pseudogemmobacter sp. W21_MBD1_M6 TaxID=3240271 RepID=UPI003F9E4C86
MGQRFRGEGHHKVDAKGRVSIPAPFRRVLESADPDWKEGLLPNMVIVYGDHRRKFLECYTIEAIQEVDERIAGLARGSIERRMLERMFNGQSLPTQLDNTGRFVLPKALREKIGLDDEAYFIASGDTFQIWKPETYAEVETHKTEEWLDQLPEDFDVLSLLETAKGA